jgi:hypothetical protein
MKKTILILLALTFMAYPIKGQDKINPDGYIGKFSLMAEFGINQSGGKYLEYIPSPSHQKVDLFGPFVRVQVCLPSTESFTLFTNGYINSLRGNEDNENINIQDIKYTQFSLSLGFKLYFK